ncbi:MAG: response regulator [Gemmatimonadetes bacterium]|nr:response regulator [Gemmatimonadota bacterium]
MPPKDSTQVLLIEDDASVRTTLAKALEQAGFKVQGLGSPGAALALLKQQTFRAIVCDLILPEREGTSFYEQLKEQVPEMAERVLFLTGWAGDDKVRKLLEYTGRPFLAKPVDLKTLVDAVRRITD